MGNRFGKHEERDVQKGTNSPTGRRGLKED